MASETALKKKVKDAEKILQRDKASLEALVQGRKRLHTIVDNQQKGKESAAQTKVIAAIKNDISSFDDRIKTAQAQAKKYDGIVRRARKALARWRKRHQGGRVTMFDSVTVSEIPQSSQYAAAGYTSGLYPTYPQIVAGPWKPTLAVAVAPGAKGCKDVETGDYTNASAVAETVKETKAGNRVDLYTSVSNVAALYNDLLHSGADMSKVLFWTAHYDGHEHICDQACGYGITSTIAKLIAGTQWTSTALGRNLDQSLCLLKLYS